jgi:hypothetical protein
MQMEVVWQQEADESLRGSLCSRLKHCVRSTVTLQTVIISHIFSLEAADSESEICPRPTATEAVRDPRCPGGCPVDEKFRRLSFFLLVPSQVVLLVGAG